MFREINIEDAQEVAEICKVALDYDVDVENVKRQIEKLTNDKKQHIIIGYEDENTRKIIGFVHAQMYESFYSDLGLNILGLAVNPDFQGKGIGKKLMSKLENYAVDNNISFIRLNSALKREDAHKFYEHIGYTCDKVQKRFIKLFEWILIYQILYLIRLLDDSNMYRPQKVRPKNLTFWRSVFLWLNIILNLKRKSY